MQQDSPIKTVYDLARRKKIFVEYRLEKESGPTHAKLYTVRLYLGNKDYVSTEHTIKLAKLAAAQLALSDQNDLSIKNEYDQRTSEINVFQSPIVALSNWASRHHISIHYVLLNEQFKLPSLNHSRISFYYRLYLGDDSYFDGHGYTHQQARTRCALNAFNFLRQSQVIPQQFNILSSPIPKTKHRAKSDISLMYERAKQLGLSVNVSFNDPYTVTYKIGENYSATGKGFNKASAKQVASKKMLEILPSSNIQRKLNPITRIYQLAQLRQVKIEFIELSDKEKFTYQIKFGDNEIAEGHGKTKQLAKQTAAETLLSTLEPAVVLPPPPIKGLLKRDRNNESQSKHEKKHVHFVEDIIEKDDKISSRQSLSSPSTTSSNKQKLIEACVKLNIHIEYSDKMNESENTDSSRFQSIVILSTNGRVLAQFLGQGSSLVCAQENVSSAVWNNLKQLFNGSAQLPKSKRKDKNNRQSLVKQE